MMRASEVLPAGSWDPAREWTEIALPYDGRHRRRLVLQPASGESFLLDLAAAHALRDGDGLVLDDGRVVRVVASPEPVADVVGTPHLLLRVAWHIGNRHIPCQLLDDRIRIARDHVLEAMVRGLGAEVELVEAAFQPEPGAYAQGGHAHVDDADTHGEDATGQGHEHGHVHQHDHAHEQQRAEVAPGRAQHHEHGHDHAHTPQHGEHPGRR